MTDEGMVLDGLTSDTRPRGRSHLGVNVHDLEMNSHQQLEIEMLQALQEEPWIEVDRIKEPDPSDASSDSPGELLAGSSIFIDDLHSYCSFGAKTQISIEFVKF